MSLIIFKGTLVGFSGEPRRVEIFNNEKSTVTRHNTLGRYKSVFRILKPLFASFEIGLELLGWKLIVIAGEIYSDFDRVTPAISCIKRVLQRFPDNGFKSSPVGKEFLADRIAFHVIWSQLVEKPCWHFGFLWGKYENNRVIYYIPNSTYFQGTFLELN